MDRPAAIAIDGLTNKEMLPIQASPMTRGRSQAIFRAQIFFSMENICGSHRGKGTDRACNKINL